MVFKLRNILNIHYQSYALQNTDLILYDIIPLNKNHLTHDDFVFTNIVPKSSFDELIQCFEEKSKLNFYHFNYLPSYYIVNRDDLEQLRQHQLSWNLFIHRSVSYQKDSQLFSSIANNKENRLVFIPDRETPLIFSLDNLIEAQCLYFTPTLFIPPAHCSIWEKRDHRCLIKKEYLSQATSLSDYFFKQFQHHLLSENLLPLHPFQYDLRHAEEKGFYTDKNVSIPLQFKIDSSLYQPLWQQYINFLTDQDIVEYGCQANFDATYFPYKIHFKKLSLHFVSLLAFHYSSLSNIPLDPLNLYQYYEQQDRPDIGEGYTLDSFYQIEHDFEMERIYWKKNYLQSLILNQKLPENNSLIVKNKL